MPYRVHSRPKMGSKNALLLRRGGIQAPALAKDNLKPGLTILLPVSEATALHDRMDVLTTVVAFSGPMFHPLEHSSTCVLRA